MREQVLELLKDIHEAKEVIEINDLLGLQTSEELRELQTTLDELVNEYIVFLTKKGKYILLDNCPGIKIGKLSVNKKGFGFVILDKEDDLYVDGKNLNGAVQDDVVLVEVFSSGVRDEGRVVRIIKRDLKNIVGEIAFHDDGKPYLLLDDDKKDLDIEIEKESAKDCVEGHKVLVKVEKELGKKKYLASVVKIIGHKNDPGTDILSIAYKYGIYEDLGEEVEKELEDIPNEVDPKELSGRKDLTDMVIFTIDGDDTKDIDDAISIEKLDNGNYKLGVHIADVSYYVKENSPLDKEALSRGTSVYLADRVTPMLPHELSNGICSLNPNVDRFALSCVMEIDSKGDVVDYEIFDSIIRSRIQMTYKKVNKVIEEDIIPEGYEEFADKLKLMKELADILRANKVAKGYIDFEINEAKVIVNEDGEAIDVVLRERGAGEKLIEDFMIAANETVASHFANMDYPLIYRVHGEPSEEKMTNFLHLVSIMGYKLTGNFKKITPKAIQEMLDQLKDKKEYYILSSQMLRSMQKAVYDTKNIGHFGLASKMYCHFTSPIRRYPDLTVHRSIRKCLLSDDMTAESISKWEHKLPMMAEHSSQKERGAIDCEREVDDMKMAEYMEKHIGEEYHGIITGVMSFGFFVQLPNMIEGLVHVEELKGDFYLYDESTFSLTSPRDKRGYRLGDEVDVIVKSASKENHTVDFELKEAKKCKVEE